MGFVVAALVTLLIYGVCTAYVCQQLDKDGFFDD